MFKHLLNQAFGGLVFFILTTVNSWAASFIVNPVIAHLTEQQTITSLMIKNQSSTPTAIELELYRWNQVDGKEKLTPAPELLATPAIFKIPANASQIIRVGSRQSITSSEEKAYRLIMTEIPSQSKQSFQGLNVLLRISIPIFLSKTISSPELIWKASVNDDGKLLLSIANTGLGHTKILKHPLLVCAAS